MYKIYIRNARRRGESLVGFMVLEEFLELIKRNCWFCDRTPEQAKGMGVDRIDNSQGHIHGNIEACCGICNRMRMDSSVESFLEQCETIIENKKRKDVLCQQQKL